MIHLEMGFASLFDFTVKHLGLSEASAYRRIATMRLVREIPRSKTAWTGALTLTNVAAAHTFFRAEREAGTETNPR